jgi:hypothetical protein
MLRWLMTVVVSDEEKAHMMCQVGIRKANASESLMTCRNQVRRHRNRGISVASGRAWRVPVCWPGGVRHEGDASLICGFCTEREKARLDMGVGHARRREGVRQAAETVRRRVPSRDALADQLVVVMNHL